jgi:hypothetical protein
MEAGGFELYPPQVGLPAFGGSPQRIRNLSIYFVFPRDLQDGLLFKQVCEERLQLLESYFAAGFLITCGFSFFEHLLY